MVGHVIRVGNQDIFGYSRYINFYNRVVADAEDGELFVEVGSFLGQSTAALAFFIKHSKKRIALHAVDLFELNEFSDEPHFKVIEEHGGDFLAAFESNLRGAEVDDYVTVIQASSLDAAKQYEDRSISFLMIDASHKYEDVVDDIRAWYPKIKMGGIISGDDYDWPEVKRAVEDTLGSHSTFEGSTWVVKKQHLLLEDRNS